MSFSAHGTCCILDSVNEMLNALLGVKTVNNLPMMYTNSLIHKSVYKSVKSKQDLFFCSIVPDMSAAAAIVLTEKYFIECGIPFGFVGTSRVSSSYCYASNDPNFDMREVKLNLKSKLKFNPKVGSLDHENLKNSSTIMEGFRVVFLNLSFNHTNYNPRL